MIAAIYARKSNPQEGAAGTRDSVERQIEHSRRYAAERGSTVADAHICSDDDISGATDARLDRRKRLVDVCEAGAPFVRERLGGRPWAWWLRDPRGGFRRRAPRRRGAPMSGSA